LHLGHEGIREVLASNARIGIKQASDYQRVDQRAFRDCKGVSMMTRRQISSGLVGSVALSGGTTVAVAQERKPVKLPPPREQGGMPLTAALKLRRSTREYSGRPLPAQTLSDLLWAAFGVNRPSGDRTAPYWRHVMVIDIFVAMADGVWVYEPKTHTLLFHQQDDIRAQTGLQDFVATAPLNLVYVAHGDRMKDISAEERRLYASVDAGFIGQNVYLFCASEGLATVFRGAVDYAGLARTLKLPAQQFVTFAQTVGYPRT
jgi:nitroreductase